MAQIQLLILKSVYSNQHSAVLAPKSIVGIDHRFAEKWCAAGYASKDLKYLETHTLSGDMVPVEDEDESGDAETPDTDPIEDDEPRPEDEKSDPVVGDGGDSVGKSKAPKRSRARAGRKDAK